MICTKCNSIIPDEAKFCPSCGATCSQEAPKPQADSMKCSKCGLELEPSAKFCPVCGTAVSGISLNKQPDSNSLVSAMPGSAPTPVEVPAPAPYAPPADAIPNSFGEPASMPQYAPPAGAGGFGEFGDVGRMGAAGSAAAVTAAPVKKKNGSKIAIIIAAAVVVLIAAAAVLFFTNKATFLSAFMGKSKYAAMVEGNSVKEVAGKIDAGAISDGAKAISEFYGTLATTTGGPQKQTIDNVFPMSYNPDREKYTTKSVAYGVSNNVDFKSLIELYSKALQDSYGVDAVKVTASTKINLSDTAKTAIGADDETNKIIDAINGTTFTYDIAAKDSAMGVQFGAEGKIAINANVIMTEDGSCYLSLPFASDKALMFKFDTAESAKPSETVILELDEKEISRLIEEVVKIYLSHYEKAVSEMEKGSITVGGEEISGKLITADFTGDAVTAMVKEIITHIGEDSYLSTQILDFVNGCGAELTLDEYKKEFTDAANDVEIPSDTMFSVKTVIDRNGNILAKSYSVNSYGSAEFAYKNSGKNFSAQFTSTIDDETVNISFTKSENGCTGELVSDDGLNTFTIKLDSVKTDAKSGNATITFQENDDGEYKLNLSYSGVETVKSFGRDVKVGTFTVTVDMPEGFDEADNELFTVLDGMKITLSASAAPDSQTMELGVKTAAYGDVSFNISVDKSSSDAILAIPGNVIDATGIMNGDYDADTEQKLEDFTNEVMEALKKNDFMKDLFIGDSFDPTGITGPDIEDAETGDDDDDDEYDFDTLTVDELEFVTAEYVMRLAEVSEYGDYTPELESKLYEAQDAMNEMSNYKLAVDNALENNNIDVSMIRSWRKSLKEFAKIVEECEALAY